MPVEYLNLTQAARILSRDPRTLRRWLARNGLLVDVAGRPMVRREDLSRVVRPTPEPAAESEAA
jgi:hypothetical protein